MSLEYRNASKIVEVGLKGQSLKKFCASWKNLKKGEYALAVQTLKYIQVLKDLLSDLEINHNTDEVKELDDVQKPLLYVMLYDLFFSNGRKINGGGAVKKKIVAVKPLLEQTLEKKMKGKSSYEELLPSEISEINTLPVHVRINTVSISLNEGREYLQHHFHQDIPLQFDEIIPSLIALPPSVKGISQDEYVKSGKLVLQDKASCFPSQILSNIWNNSISNQCRGQFIDGCSAPGNKTSHLAACLLDSRYFDRTLHAIHAFEKNKGRFQLLRQRMQQYQVSSVVQTRQQDFLAVDVSQYQNVTHILMDPSCSGSGIIRNIERFSEEARPSTEADSPSMKEDGDVEGDDLTASQRRVLQLQAFQLLVLKKAMSFPNAQFIVYSTCSVHEEENEIVVSKLLGSDEGADWELMEPVGFESWTRRGHTVEGITSQDAQKMIRCLPSDGMNGFFVAAMKRKQIQHVVVQPSLLKNAKDGEVQQGKTSSIEKFTTVLKDKKSNALGSNTKLINNQNFRVSSRKKKKFSKKF